jgi:hypothetical protein
MPDESRDTSPFQFMSDTSFIAAVCPLYYVLQKYMPKKLSEGEDGYEDDHGYLPPIADEHGVTFFTWWDPQRPNLSTTRIWMKVLKRLLASDPHQSVVRQHDLTSVIKPQTILNKHAFFVSSP